MKKNLKKLSLKKTTVVLLGNENHRLVTGNMAATKPVISCKFACTTTTSDTSVIGSCIPPTEPC